MHLAIFLCMHRTCTGAIFPCFPMQQVVSSVVDQDSYVGFVGVQSDRQKGRVSPVDRGHPPRPPTKMAKPDIPPPAPHMKIRPRTSSLSGSDKSGPRPPKTECSPSPPFHPEGNMLKEKNGLPRNPLRPNNELSSQRPPTRSPSPKVT